MTNRLPRFSPFRARRGKLAAVALTSASLVATIAWASEQRVEVSAGQVTTVVGNFDSLSALLIDLCEKADVELRAFDAPDRTIGTKQEARPLVEVIERLLSRENFLLGIQDADAQDDPARLVWIRVTGAKSSASGAGAGGISVPSGFGATEFERESPDDASRAGRAVADRLLADDAHVALFLRADSAELAGSLEQYPHIEVLLRELRAEQQDPAVVAKIDDVIRELAERRSTTAD